MKAWVLNRIGDIALQEVDEPSPGEGEVRICVKAAGICGSDIPRIYETGAHKMPLIPGHEFAGVVDAVGEGVSADWIGKRVAVFPKIPCGRCEFCAGGRPDLCQSYDYVGSRRNGAFAEFVTAPARNLMALPERVSMEAAAMIEPLAVAANAVRTARWEMHADSAAGVDAAEAVALKRIAVCGMGTIGLMIVLFLQDAGFSEIYVIGNREDQKEKAAKCGIAPDRFCDCRTGDPVEWLKNTAGGVDIYFECVGSNDSIRYGLEAGAPGSLQVLVGNPRSDMAFSRDVYWQIPRNQLRLVGIWNSVFRQDPREAGRADEAGAQITDDWHYVLERLESGTVDPAPLISHRFLMDELDRGFLLMRDKTESYTKVMMVR